MCLSDTSVQRCWIVETTAYQRSENGGGSNLATFLSMNGWISE